MKTQRAFTLIEVLCMMAIIALMGAILFPVFGQAREKARVTVCASNLRQIWTAAALYRVDYDDYWPYAVGESLRRNPENAGSEHWDKWKGMQTLTQILQPYAKSTQIFHCPDDVNAGVFFDVNGAKKTFSDRFSAYESSYSLESIGFFQYREGDTKHTTSTVDPWDKYLSDVEYDYHSHPNAAWYARQGNYVCLDGHVKFGRNVWWASK